MWELVGRVLGGRVLASQRRVAPVVVWTAAAGAGVTLGVGLIGRHYGVYFVVLAVDPLAVTGAPWYTGAFSNLGVLVLCAAAAVCLFAAAVVRAGGRERGRARFLLWSGLLTALVTLDDLYQLHESALPDGVGIPEVVVYGAYAVLSAAYLAAFWRVILGTEFLLLAAAGAMMACTIVIDLLVGGAVAYRSLMEDGSKFVGIVLWGTYFVRTSYAWARLEVLRGEEGTGVGSDVGGAGERRGARGSEEPLAV